ncbi:DUF2721 domain-containing protein [Sphingobium subterraneum]|uniref:DUF2721 domain-containing protein n=1 Tax=Sphingobium subterraneum TaxID=627688 RepID=A0A841J0B6_9SPHN|nr:DUF2721 domain-containing protein [Sphingobium subterraneum]MBB6124287.1 hypothetical protein [Sphingobium subterraneum]
MLTAPQAAQVAQTIQLALAPVFLLAAIGTFLNVCTGRLARVIDRSRAVQRMLLVTQGREHSGLVRELDTLDVRMTVVNTAIFMAAASGATICGVVILLFAAELFDVHMGTPIALLFMLAMILLSGGFATFIREIHLASRTLHIRNEVLGHGAREP